MFQVPPLLSSYQTWGWVVGQGVVEGAVEEVVVVVPVPVPGESSPWRGMEEVEEEEGVDLCSR